MYQQHFAESYGGNQLAPAITLSALSDTAGWKENNIRSPVMASTSSRSAHLALQLSNATCDQDR